MRQGFSTKSLVLILVLAGVLSLSGGGGCAKAFKPESSASLKPGMSKAQVEQHMGKPMSTQTKPPATEVWTYDRHDPISSRFERIELRFENGVYKDMSKSSPPNE